MVFNVSHMHRRVGRLLQAVWFGTVSGPVSLTSKRRRLLDLRRKVHLFPCSLPNIKEQKATEESGISSVAKGVAGVRLQPGNS